MPKVADMLKFALAILMVAVVSNALAEWVPVVRWDNDVVYADPATIRRSGSLVKMWEIFDYKTAKVLTGKAYLSFKAQNEYDCDEKRTRNHYVVYYSGNLGRGNSVGGTDGTVSTWVPIVPETVGEALWKFACEKG